MSVYLNLRFPENSGTLLLYVISSIFSFSQIHSQTTSKSDSLDMSQMMLEMDVMNDQKIDTSGTKEVLETQGDFTVNQIGGLFKVQEEGSDFWYSYLWKPMRIGIKYEFGYIISEPDRIIKNRFTFGLAYSGALADFLFLKMDAKLFSFMGGDHQSRNSNLWLDDDEQQVDIAFGSLIRDAYLQASFGNTSIKAGIQAPVWGESDFAVITDEISPFDYREPLNLNIDQIRFGQLMFSVDQYSSIGRWTFIFVPDPKLNKHPGLGTNYYYDPFNGSVELQRENQDDNLFEYGMRWRKTLGKSDISVMAASLIDNEYALEQLSPGVISRSKHRFFMTGITFNRAISSFLLKGELAYKSGKAYNNSSFEIVEKDALDMSLGVDYSVNNSLTLRLEAINYHVLDWTDEIQGVPRNNYMFFFVISKMLMKDDLALNAVTMYNGPHTGFFNLLTSTYNWSDNITLNFDVILPITSDANSGYYPYRDQKQFGFGILYQF